MRKVPKVWRPRRERWKKRRDGPRTRRGRHTLGKFVHYDHKFVEIGIVFQGDRRRFCVVSEPKTGAERRVGRSEWSQLLPGIPFHGRQGGEKNFPLPVAREVKAARDAPNAPITIIDHGESIGDGCGDRFRAWIFRFFLATGWWRAHPKNSSETFFQLFVLIADSASARRSCCTVRSFDCDWSRVPSRSA